MYAKNIPPVARIALAMAGGREDDGLSQRQLGLGGVSRPTIAKIEAGGRVRPAPVVRQAVALVDLDVYREPRFDDRVEVASREGLRVAA